MTESALTTALREVISLATWDNGGENGRGRERRSDENQNRDAVDDSVLLQAHVEEPRAARNAAARCKSAAAPGQQGENWQRPHGSSLSGQQFGSADGQSAFVVQTGMKQSRAHRWRRADVQHAAPEAQSSRPSQYAAVPGQSSVAGIHRSGFVESTQHFSLIEQVMPPQITPS